MKSIVLPNAAFHPLCSATWFTSSSHNPVSHDACLLDCMPKLVFGRKLPLNFSLEAEAEHERGPTCCDCLANQNEELTTHLAMLLVPLLLGCVGVVARRQ